MKTKRKFIKWWKMFAKYMTKTKVIFIHSLNNYLLSSYYVSVFVSRCGRCEQDQVPALMESTNQPDLP